MVRERLKLSSTKSFLESLIRRVLKKPTSPFSDSAQWISNGIKEVESLKHIELHVVSPHYGLNESLTVFQNNGVNYHFFKPDDQTITSKIIKRLFGNFKKRYLGNRKVLKNIISNINPDIIHMYGAENPIYSISGLDIDFKKHPFLVTLQTLMSDDDFKTNYPISEDDYNFRMKIEKNILERVSYIGSEIEKYRYIVWNHINPDAIFFHAHLALSERITINNSDKKYDFVYFSASIDKAADIAIEAFALAHRKFPQLTLNVIGETPEPFTSILMSRIIELGLQENVFFSGKLISHTEVLNQIQLSKFALLPIKIDIISGTIREAMFSGLPVVTTITPGGTPTLNNDRESVLLSDKEDSNSIAKNMIRLIENPSFAEELKENAIITVNERWNNTKIMEKLLIVYKAIINHHKNGVAISNELGTENPYLN